MGPTDASREHMSVDEARALESGLRVPLLFPDHVARFLRYVGRAGGLRVHWEAWRWAGRPRLLEEAGEKSQWQFPAQATALPLSQLQTGTLRAVCIFGAAAPLRRMPRPFVCLYVGSLAPWPSFLCRQGDAGQWALAAARAQRAARWRRHYGMQDDAKFAFVGGDLWWSGPGQRLNGGLQPAEERADATPG